MAELPQMKPFGAEIQQRLTALETATGVSGGGEAGDIVLVTEESLEETLAEYSKTSDADQKYLGKDAKAESAKAADSVPMSGVTGLSTELQGLVKKSGARGQLAGYETTAATSGATVTIGYATGDYITHDATSQTTVTVTVDGASLEDIATAGGIKVLFIQNAASVTTLTVNSANGITKIDWEGDGAPSLDGAACIRLVLQLHGATASISIKQWTPE